MSLQIGQYGSLTRADYVQPAVRRGDPNNNFVALGAYLQAGPYASLSPEDPSRFRPNTYVAPTQIELMQGFMDTAFQNANPYQSDTRVVPGSTFVTQRPAPAPTSSLFASSAGASFESFASPPGYSFETTRRTHAPAATSRNLQGGGGAGGGAIETAPYGLVVNAGVSPSNCLAEEHCFLNLAGGCACTSQSPWYDRSSSNVYF